MLIPLLPAALDEALFERRDGCDCPSSLMLELELGGIELSEQSVDGTEQSLIVGLLSNERKSAKLEDHPLHEPVAPWRGWHLSDGRVLDQGVQVRVDEGPLST